MYFCVFAPNFKCSLSLSALQLFSITVTNTFAHFPFYRYVVNRAGDAVQESKFFSHTERKNKYQKYALAFEYHKMAFKIRFNKVLLHYASRLLSKLNGFSSYTVTSAIK